MSNEAKEETKIKAVISSTLPYGIHLNDGAYEVIHEGEKNTIEIEKAFKYPSKDKIPPEKAEIIFTAEDIKTAQNAEYEKDDMGIFTYTRFRIIVSVPKILIEGSEKKEVADFRPFFLPVLNKLIKTYRYFGNEEYATYIKPQDITLVNILFPDAKKGEFKGGIFFYAKNKLMISKNLLKTEEIHKKIREALLDESFDIPFYEELLINAKYFKFVGDYRMAIIEAVIALESYLTQFLKSRWIKKGLTENVIEGKFRNLGLSLLLQTELKLETNNSIDSHLISDVSGINTLRNKIIHEGFKNILVSDAEKAIENISRLIKELILFQ